MSHRRRPGGFLVSSDRTNVTTTPDQPRPAGDSPSAEQMTGEKVLVLDFGSQYAQLIARRVREQPNTATETIVGPAIMTAVFNAPTLATRVA